MTQLWTQSLTITPEMLRLVSEIEAFNAVWKTMAHAEPGRLSTLRRVATIESIASSTRIEGSRLSDAEVDALLSASTGRSLATRDAQEVAGYADVMDLGFRDPAELIFSEALIRQLHAMLLAHHEQDRWHRGGYKQTSNKVAAIDHEGRQVGIFLDPPSPAETPLRMRELVDWFRWEQDRGELHPLLLIGMFTAAFLEIHPFQDGNGRLSRILMTLLLLQAGYDYVPYSSLESVIEESKTGYYRSLHNTQVTLRTDSPNWTPWLLFFLRALHRQMTRLETKIALTTAAPVDDTEHVIAVIRELGSASISEIASETGINRNTLKRRLRVLVAEGRVVSTGAGRSVRYRLPSDV